MTNQEVLDRSGSSSMELLLLKVQLRWTGHVIRMDDGHTPRTADAQRAQSGLRQSGEGGPNSDTDTLKSNLKWCVAFTP